MQETIVHLKPLALLLEEADSPPHPNPPLSPLMDSGIFDKGEGFGLLGVLLTLYLLFRAVSTRNLLTSARYFIRSASGMGISPLSAR